MLRSIVKEVENLEYSCIKIFRMGRWNYSSLKYSLKSVANIPTLGIKTGPRIFHIRDCWGPSTIPRQPRPWEKNNNLLSKRGCIDSHTWEV